MTPLPCAKAKPVAYDARSLLIRGKRMLMISGEVHYARSPRELWPAILDRSVACGINTITSYCFWNFHERSRDVYDFSGDRDLRHYLALCAERDLAVFLRIGPYCCAEWNFGGFPPYLRDEPGIRLRTANRPYLDRVEKYFRHLGAEIRPYLATQGGPVILVQVENEYDFVSRRYGRSGARYMEWISRLAAEVGIDVPTASCESGGGESTGAVPFATKERTLKCVNGFGVSPERLRRFRREHRTMPVIWTELWPGWYDTWGYGEHRRNVLNIAYCILDFIRQGGSGWNYYMWHAGTNFGRNGMYLQATRYGMDAPLDEYGRPTPKAQTLAKLHRLLQACAPLLFEGRRAARALPNGLTETIWKLGRRSLCLLTNPGAVPVAYDGLVLPARSARLRDAAGATLFDTHATPGSGRRRRPAPGWTALPAFRRWRCWSEPMPKQRRDDPVVADRPVDQLRLTKDGSDYCWYSTTVAFDRRAEHRLEITHGGDHFQIWLDGRPAACSQPPFREVRGPSLPKGEGDPLVITSLLDRQTGGFRHGFRLSGGAGAHRLDILASALGLIKGDWQISGPMTNERKGIWHDVLLDGARLDSWRMRPFLVGEQRNLTQRADAAGWEPWKADRRPLRWYTTDFAVPADLLAADADFRLDASGLGKGMLFLNGRGLGRHWLIAAQGYGAGELWQDRDRFGLSIDPAKGPTQRHYHVPRAWLCARNRLTLFEEYAAGPAAVKLEVRRAR